jgi:hypothetical protein
MGPTLSLLDYRPPPSGMTRAVEHADRASEGWSARAFDALVSAARSMPGPFTIEEVRARCVVDAPPDLRAWGAVVARAKRTRAIRETGAWAPTISSNGSPKRLWVAA